MTKDYFCGSTTKDMLAMWAAYYGGRVKMLILLSDCMIEIDDATFDYLVYDNARNAIHYAIQSESRELLYA